MSSEIVLGIDLGTTNSVVAVADSVQARVLRDVDGSQLIPSVVSFEGGGRVMVGEVARERRLSDAANTVYAVKRLIGRPFHSPEVRAAIDRCAFELVPGRTGGVDVKAHGEQWTLPEISAYVLRECRRRAEQVLGRSCDKAVITVPANFNELQRSATKAAGAIAGLDVLRILNEPTAAAVAYGYGGSEVRRVAIYDLGGGTFDLTILELHDEVFEVVATAGDTFLGGDDFDRIIAERMAAWCVESRGFDPRTDPQAFERLRAAAEWAKCMLSSQAQVRVRVPELTTGRDGKPLGLRGGPESRRGGRPAHAVGGGIRDRVPERARTRRNDRRRHRPSRLGRRLHSSSARPKDRWPVLWPRPSARFRSGLGGRTRSGNSGLQHGYRGRAESGVCPAITRRIAGEAACDRGGPSGTTASACVSALGSRRPRPQEGSGSGNAAQTDGADDS